MDNPVVIKGSTGGITVLLDSEKTYDEIKEAVAAKFKASSSFLGKAKMAIAFDGRDLTDDQRVELLDVIKNNSELEVIAVYEKSESMKKSISESESIKRIMKDPLNARFHKGNLRSGQSVDCESSVIIIGDVNPGASVVSNGNIIILGSLKGTAFAGALGNRNAFVMALDMNPMQIRIAETIARSPDSKEEHSAAGYKEPKIAFLNGDDIFIEEVTRNILSEIKLTED